MVNQEEFTKKILALALGASSRILCKIRGAELIKNLKTNLDMIPDVNGLGCSSEISEEVKSIQAGFTELLSSLEPVIGLTSDSKISHLIDQMNELVDKCGGCDIFK